MFLARGLAAGAVGTLVLDALTYTDMAFTGRPASDAPARTALALAGAAGLDLPTSGSRAEAYGALSGMAAGVGVGLVAGVVRGAGVRLPLLAEAAVIGGAAMAVTDGAIHGSGVSDVATWGAQDWLRDAVPHLGYGLAVGATLRALERRSSVERTTAADDERLRPSRRGQGSAAGVLTRSLALGVAAGCRSTTGVLPLAAAGRRRAVLAGGLVATELTVDKLPATPERTDPGPLAGRLLLGALGAAALARREDRGVVLPVLAGAAGALAGTLGGLAARQVAADRGITWPAAVVEDVVALGLASWASR